MVGSERGRMLIKTTRRAKITKLNISLINGLIDGWEQKVVAAVDTRKNFVLILENAQIDLLKICKGIEQKKLPDRLERWGVSGLYDVLTDEEFQTLQKAQREGYPVFLFEQLFLTRNTPPRIKKFLVYCEVRGIMSDHDSEEEAHKALRKYVATYERMKHLPLAGLYEWQGQTWTKLRRW